MRGPLRPRGAAPSGAGERNAGATDWARGLSLGVFIDYAEAMRFALSLALVAVFASACCAAPTPESAPPPAVLDSADLVGTWRNERGSEVRIDRVVDGRLTGAFRSGVGRVDPSAWFQLAGFVRGDVVGFVVDFQGAGSVGSWAGQVDGDRLVTTWHLARNVPDDKEAEALWSAVLTGADTFARK